MVTNSITDGKRIAQLLASELTGLRTGGLDTIGVEEADPDAMPSDTGTLAYEIVDDSTLLASVYLYPAYIELEFAVDRQSNTVTDDRDTDTVQVISGADVKDAVDLIRETTESQEMA